MSNRTLTTSASVFRDVPDYTLDLRLAVQKVAADSGKGPLRQYSEYLAARFGQGSLSQQEYYRFGLHRDEFSADQRAAFLGDRGYLYLNHLLSPDDRAAHARLLHDKLYFSVLMQASGFPVPHLQAHFSSRRRAEGVRNLASADDIRDFLQNQARFPLFGKPGDRAYAIGTLSIRGLDDNGRTAVLGNGDAVPLDALCADLAATYPRGYLFQDHLVQHPVAAAACGTAIGALRIFTLMHDAGPVVLYAMQRIPGANAMSDAFHHSSRQNADIDVATGVICQHFHADRTFGQPVELARFSGQPYLGQQLPFWPAITAMLLKAHCMFPGTGGIGWDVALTPSGPVLVEASSNPFQLAWQLASGRPLLAPDFAAAFLAAVLRSNRTLRRTGMDRWRYRRFVDYLRRQAQF